jgi:hypothetical protein
VKAQATITATNTPGAVRTATEKLKIKKKRN